MSEAQKVPVAPYSKELAKSFIERQPLYRKVAVASFPGSTAALRPDMVEMDCTTCGQSRPFRDERPSGSGIGMGPPPPVTTQWYGFYFRCTACRSERAYFWVEMNVEEQWIRKVGQIPPFDITPPQDVSSQLSDQDLEHYKRGLASVSQSYGIGALGYFRRIVEDTIDSLLDLVAGAARDEGDREGIEAVEAARNQHIAAKKLELVKEVLPASLRPGGANPLAVLFEEYSKGLHAQSDDECLQIAMRLRKAFDYLFIQLRNQLRAAEEFRRSIQQPSGGNE